MTARSAKRLSYAAIAAALAIAKPQTLRFPDPEDGRAAAFATWRIAIYNVADVLANGNARFNRKRFLTAAGVI